MLLNPPFNDDLSDDYRRLGIRRFECRQVIIRDAASRLAAPLASIAEDDSPDPSTTSMLSAVATSTYRLLDPRRRSNAIERALVGRVSELELLATTETHQPNGHLFGRANPFRQPNARGRNRDSQMPVQGRRRLSRLVNALPRISRQS